MQFFFKVAVHVENLVSGASLQLFIHLKSEVLPLNNVHFLVTKVIDSHVEENLHTYFLVARANLSGEHVKKKYIHLVYT